MIVVNPSTRQFNIPGADLVFGVESDSGSVRKYFQCPRHVGNDLDLAASFIRMNYRNANGEIDSYLVQDVTADGENVLFSWLLSPKTTMYKGQLSFVMCVVGPDAKVQWHTTLGRGQVLEGLEPDAAIVEEGTADVVAQLIAMVEAQTAAVEKTGVDQVAVVKAAAKAAQDAAVAEIEAKRANALVSIPNDYTAIQNAVDEVTRGKAGAIVCEAFGSSIIVSDASDLPIQSMRIFGRSTQDGIPTPDAPVEIKSVEQPDVTVYGRNLCPPSAFESMFENRKGSNIYDANAKTITMSVASATAAGRYCVPLNNLVVGNIYIVSFDLRGTPGKSVKCGWDRNPARITLTDNFIRYSSVVVATRVNEPIIFYTNAESDRGLITGEFMQFANVQIEPGPVATAYEPYRPIQTVETVRTLHGIPVTSGGNYTDDAGQQWLCDEIDLERGVYIQRVVEYELNSSMQFYPWYNEGQEIGATIRGLSWDYSRRPELMAMCSHFVPTANGFTTEGQIGFRVLGDYPYIYLYNMDGVAHSVPEWQAYLDSQIANGTPVVVLIKAENTTETPLSEAEISAYRALHTNKPNTTILNDGGAHMKVEYAADTKLYIDNKFAALTGK